MSNWPRQLSPLAMYGFTVAACFIASLTLALVVSGRDDIGFFIFASVPYSLLIGFVSRNLSRVSQRPSLRPVIFGLLVGSVIAGLLQIQANAK